MPEIKLIRKGESLVQEPEVCLYEGETLKISIDVDFDYDHYYVFINDRSLGMIRTEQFGIHSSKLKEGENDLIIDFFDNENAPLIGYHVTIIKRPSARGLNKVEEEYTNFYKKLSALEAKVDGIIKWKEEIDSERSGY